MDEMTKHSLIKGGLRTICEIVPGVGGAIATAWGEYESLRQNRRIAELFEGLGIKLRELEKLHGDLKEKVAQLPDAPELLDRIADLVKREPVESKRHLYIEVLGSFVANPSMTSHDDRLSLVESVEHLTEQDLKYLAMFRLNETLRGDILSSTTDAGWSAMGAEQELSRRYEVLLGPAIHSTAKLESRGLITPAALNAGFSSSGDGAAWYNLFRRKVWRLTPMGRKLLQAIG